MRHCLFLGAALLCGPSFAAGISGYYASASARGPTWRELCITPAQRGSVDIVLYTAYCPSDDCGNSRIDSESFRGSRRGPTIYYAKPGCTITIVVEGRRAQVKQQGDACGDDRRLVASGQYEQRSTTVPQGACTPQGMQAE
jgi:hypothetical protein